MKASNEKVRSCIMGRRMARTCNLLASVLLTLSMSGCSVFEARSGELECSQQTDCTAPRVCEMGYCVIGNDADTAVVDADPAAADAGPDARPGPDANDDEQ